MQGAEIQQTGYFVQLWVTVMRVLIQQMRNPLAALFETLLPVVIVAGLAGLSTLSPTEVRPGENYVRPSAAPKPALSLGLVLPSLVCYNDGFKPAGYTGKAVGGGGSSEATNPATLPGQLAGDAYARKMLLPCSAFYGNATNPKTGKPMALTAGSLSPWVCSDDLPRAFVAPKGLCGFYRVDQPIVAATGGLTMVNSIPSVDDMLIAQWAARLIQPFRMPDFLGGPQLGLAIKISGRVYVAAAEAAMPAARRMVAELNHSSSLFRNFAFAGYTPSVDKLAAEVFNNFDEEGSTWAVITVRKFGGPSETEAERGLDVTMGLNRSSAGWTVRARRRLYSGGPRSENQLALASGFLSLERAIGAAYADYVGGTGANAPTTAAPVPPPSPPSSNSTTTPEPTTTTTNASVNASAPPTPPPTLDDTTGGEDDSSMFLYGGPASALASAALTPSGADIAIAPMPFPDYRITRFLQIAGGLSPLLLSLALLYSVSQLVKYIVEEKEKKLRAGMQAMGLRGSIPPTAILLVFIVQGTVTAAFQTMILSLSFMPETDPSIIFVVFLLFAISSSCFAVLMSCFFSRARISGIVAPIVFLMCAIPSVAIPEDSAPRANRLLSFLSPSAFSLGVRLLLQYEQTTGMGWADAASALDEVPLAFVLFMMILDCFLYFFLAMYLDNIIKNEHGVSKSCCYCFECSGGSSGTAFQCKKKMLDEMYTTALVEPSSPTGGAAASGAGPQEMKVLKPLRSAYPDEGVVEPFAPKDKPFISLCGITKVYESQDGGPGKVAVDNMTMHMMENHITVLLSGNGGGKSTTISMITGMHTITEGDALVAGHSVRHELQTTQQLVALCPQHNLLWPQLTCMQHLLFYAQIKGMSRIVAQERGLELLRRLELYDKRDQDAGQLSGGQKRKLSVAIAFVAGSPFIILDEPTAGMDVPARRATWKLLQHMTKSRSLSTPANPIAGEPPQLAATGCSILLVTHFLDEADLLGDRIAIVSAGQLHSYGTAEFLKARLGRGYMLRFTTHAALTSAEANSLARDINSPAFGVHGAILNEAKGQEITIRLPNSQVPRIPGLLRRFSDLTADITKRYKIEAVSIEVSTMEDVFQHIADEEVQRAAKLEAIRESKAAAAAGGGSAVPSTIAAGGGESSAVSTEAALLAPSPVGSPREHYGADDEQQAQSHHNAGLSDNIKKALDICFDKRGKSKQQQPEGSPGGSFATQFVALSKKRMHYLRRDRRTICFQLVVPLLCVILAMLLTNISPPTSKALNMETLYDPEKQQIPYTETPCAASNGGTVPAGKLGVPISSASTTANLSANLLANAKKHGEAERMAAWSCSDSSILSPDLVSSPVCYPSSYPDLGGNISALVLNPACRRPTSVILGNFSSPFAQTFGLANWIAASVKRIATNKSLPTGVDAISISNMPLPFSAREQSNLDTISLIIGALFVTLPFCFVPSTFVSFIVRERETRAKMLQRVSGVNIGAFWMSHSVFDISTFLMTELLTLVVFAISDHQEYVGPKAIGVMLVLFLLMAVATTGGGYCLSFLFESHANAQTWTMLIGFLTGFVMVIFGLVLEDLDAGWVRWIFRCFPTYCFGEAIVSIALGPLRELGGRDAERWSMDQTGNALLFLGLQSIVFYAIVFLVEFNTVWLPMLKSCGKDTQKKGFVPNPAPADPSKEAWDVREERARTEAAPPPGVEPPPLRVVQLRKVYEGVQLEDDSGNNTGGAGTPGIVPKTEKGTMGRTNVVAVQNLSFTVDKGEIMGLLGLNGAGKSSALYAITGELSVSAGDAYIYGKSISSEENEARQLIGYVPQFDALFDLLTVEEHLSLYADIRGVDKASCAAVIDGLIAACDLSKYRNVISAGLSGGNKRKLSVAISLVGGPSLLLLDEPSAGIDPAARRVLWDVFTYVSQYCGTVLVGHHLEEIEALSHRVAIMAAGKMHVIGPLGRIKAAVGGGVETRIRAHSAEEIDVVYSELKDKVVRHAATHSAAGTAPVDASALLELVEHVEGRLTLRLPSAAATRANLSPANLFEWLLEMQQRQQQGKSFEFTVSNATIEQVFLAVAQQQELKGEGEDVGSPGTTLAHATSTATPAAVGDPGSAYTNAVASPTSGNQKTTADIFDDDDFLGGPAPVAHSPPAAAAPVAAVAPVVVPQPDDRVEQKYTDFDDLL